MRDFLTKLIAEMIMGVTSMGLSILSIPIAIANRSCPVLASRLTGFSQLATDSFLLEQPVHVVSEVGDYRWQQVTK